MNVRFYLAVLAVLFSANLKTVDAQDKYAVLIGVESYNEEFLSQLKFTEDDALGLAKSLSEVGFNTKVMTGQSRTSTLKPNSPKKILQILKTQMASCAKGDTMIVSLSGHGLQFGDEEPLADGIRETYFCPEDADPTNKSTLLPISQVIELLENCQASRKFLMIDACRNEFVSTEGQRKAGRKLNLGSIHETKLSIPGGMTVLFSCDQSQFSWEHDDLKHSVFTFFVMEYLNGKAGSQYYDNDSLHLDGLTRFVRKKTNDYVFRNNLSADGQSPVRSGVSADWVLGQGIDPVKSILKKHLEFVGGEAVLRSVRTYDVVGTQKVYYDDGTEGDFDVHYLGRDTTVVQTFDYDGGQLVHGSAPKVGWSIEFDTSYYHDDEMHWSNRFVMRHPFSAIEMLQHASEFKLGPKVKFGEETATKLTINHKKTGSPTHWYFADDGKLVGIGFQVKDSDQDAEIHLSNHRTFEGINIPMREKVYFEGKMTSMTNLTDASINPKLDASIFSIPQGLSSSAEAQQVQKTNDEIDQMVSLYQANREQIIEAWGGYVSDLEISRENEVMVRFEYTLANGIIEASNSGAFNVSTFKPAFIEANLADEEREAIRSGLQARIVFKSSGGSVVCKFDITANDLK